MPSLCVPKKALFVKQLSLALPSYYVISLKIDLLSKKLINCGFILDLHINCTFEELYLITKVGYFFYNGRNEVKNVQITYVI